MFPEWRCPLNRGAPKEKAFFKVVENYYTCHLAVINSCSRELEASSKAVEVKLACIASFSLRFLFQSKERRTRVEDRAKNGARKRVGRENGSALECMHGKQCQE